MERPVNRRITRLVLVAVLMFALIGGGVFAVRNALQEEWRREAFLPELEERVRQDPADARSLALLAARMAEAKEYTTATAICEKAVGAGIREPALWLTWASCFAAANDLNKARAVLQLAVGSGKCQPSGPAREALSRLQAPLAEAERTGQTSDPTAIASVISPDGIRPLVALYASGSFLNPVMNYRQKSDPERGGFSSRQRQALAKPDDPLAQARWVQALSKNRRLPEAETESRRLVTRFPDSPEIRLAYGDALFQGKIFAKAGLQYKAALSLRPDWLPALKGLGAVAVEKSLFRLAIENYEKAVKFAPNDVDAWIGLGRAHLQQAFRMDRALESFRNAERLAPNRTDFYPYYADALTFTYHADEAETILRRRLAAAPEDARSRYLLANIILNGKADNARIAEAEEHLRTSLKIEPNVPVVKIRLAQLLLDRADASSAADAGILLVEALEGDPRNILAVRLLAQAYQRIGKIDKAKETREQADQLAKYITEVSRLEDLERNRPDDISVHRALRDLYTRNDEPDKAKRQEEMIYMLENHPEAAKRGLSTLMEAATKTGQVSGETKPPGMNAP